MPGDLDADAKPCCREQISAGWCSYGAKAYTRCNVPAPAMSRGRVVEEGEERARRGRELGFDLHQTAIIRAKWSSETLKTEEYRADCNSDISSLTLRKAIAESQSSTRSRK